MNLHALRTLLIGSAMLTTLAVPASGFAQPSAGGPYQLRNAASCVASGTATGADLALEPCAATAADQAFYLVTATGGTFEVQSDANGGVLDVTGASADVGAALLSWQSNGAANQRFAFNTRGADAYELRPAHATDRCVAAQGDGSVRLAACDAASAAQSWQLVALEATSAGDLRDCTADELYRPRFVENTQGGPAGSNVVIMVGGYMMLIYAFDSGGPPGILTTYDVTDPRRPTQVARIDDAHTERFREAHSLPVALVSGTQYVAIQTIDGIQFWDVTDPLDAQYVSQIDLPGVTGGDYENVAWQADWQGNDLYVAGANQGIYVVDTSDIANPELITQVPTGRTGGFRIGPLYARGPYLVIGNMDQDGAISVLDIARPDQPALLGTIDGLPRMYTIVATGDRIFGAGRDGDLTIHSFEDPTTIEEIEIARIEQDSLYVATQDHFVFSGRQNNFVKIDVSDELGPRIVGEGTLGRANPDHGQVTPLGNWVFIGNDHGSGSALFCHAETDELPLAVEKIFPADGSVQQDPRTQITIFFSDYVDTATVTPTNVAIRPSGGEPLEGVYTYNFNTLSFSPNEPFAQNATIEIALGADGVKDVSGNPLGEEVIARFSTGDSIVIAPPPVEPDAGVTAGGSGGTGGSAATAGSAGAATVDTGGMGAPPAPSSAAGTSGMPAAPPVASTSGGGEESETAPSGCSCRIGPRGQRSHGGPFLAVAAAAWIGRRRSLRARARAGQQ
jgi:hypothetical protein